MVRPLVGQRPPQKSGPRVNEQIRVLKVRLIDENGENQGVVARDDALRRARDAGLDLVEISPEGDIPVCKIINYGKYKYNLQKKQAENRKKQKVIEVKELKIRPAIDENDYQVKLRNAQRFLGEGNKVKVTLRFRGREVTHAQLGLKVLQRMISDLEDLGKVEYPPKLDGKQMIMILVP